MGDGRSLLCGTGRPGELEGDSQRCGDQIVIGVENIHGPTDAVMQADRNAGRLRQETYVGRLLLRRDIERASLSSGPAHKGCHVVTGVL